MCGRYTLRASRTKITEVLPLFEVPELEPRINIAPTQPVPVARIRREPLTREVTFLRWGLVPGWVDDLKSTQPLINARAETVARKPSFRAAYKYHRCLILADGYYEWQKVGKLKQPYFIRLKSDAPFAFAGLWERWERDGNALESCTIITTDASAQLQALHNRMPVILKPADHERWLDPENQTGAGLSDLLVPYTPEEMEWFPVNTRINKAGSSDLRFEDLLPATNGSELSEPLA
jgi:putative SOS response-associated peptidase YedK